MSDWLLDVITLARLRLEELLADKRYTTKKRQLNKARRVINKKRRYTKSKVGRVR